jgi:THO complex subunit 1 transcription elongation factor
MDAQAPSLPATVAAAAATPAAMDPCIFAVQEAVLSAVSAASAVSPGSLDSPACIVAAVESFCFNTHKRTAVELGLGHAVLLLLASAERACEEYGHGEKLAAANAARLSEVSATFAIVDAATALFARELLPANAAPLLLQHVLNLAPVQPLLACVASVSASFAAMKRANLPASHATTRYAITKAVILCLRRPGLVNMNDFVGRLRTSLMSILPAWETSGINHKGTYNVSNETNYAAESTVADKSAAAAPTTVRSSSPDAIDMDTDSAPTNGEPHSSTNCVDTSATTIDWALYKSFWGVQRYLANPKLVESPAGWEVVYSRITAILTAFETIRVQPNPAPPAPETRWPKYLTSPTLLRLQLSDINLRRSVLIQYAILLHHLELNVAVLSRSPDVRNQENGKYAAALFASTAVQRQASQSPASQAAPPHSGNGDRLAYRVLTHLASLDGDKNGNGLSDFLTTCRAREACWMTWKSNGCNVACPAEEDMSRDQYVLPQTGPRRTALKQSPSTIPDPTDPADSSHLAADWKDSVVSLKRVCYGLDRNYSRANTDQGSETRRASGRPFGKGWMPMTSEERSAMFLTPGNSNVATSPTLVEYQDAIKTEIEDGIEDEYANYKLPSFVWRCMRALSEQNCESFLMVADVELQKYTVAPFDLRRLILPQRIADVSRLASDKEGVLLRGDAKADAKSSGGKRKGATQNNTNGDEHDGFKTAERGSSLRIVDVAVASANTNKNRLSHVRANNARNISPNLNPDTPPYAAKLSKPP